MSAISGLLFIIPSYYAVSIGIVWLGVLIGLLSITSVGHIFTQWLWLRAVDYALVVVALCGGVHILWSASFPYPASLYAASSVAAALSIYALYRSTSDTTRKDLLYITWHILAATMALVTLWASTM